MAMFGGGGRQRAAEQVYVNVYDLSPANEYLFGLGLGIYHSGLEVYGTEYTFGSGGGVFSHQPKEANGAKWRVRLYLGDIHIGSREVEAAVASLRENFHGDRYSLVNLNCNHFADALARKLLGRGLPGWINRMAFLGSYCSCLMPPEMAGEAPVQAPGGGGGGGGGRAGAGAGSAFGAGVGGGGGAGSGSAVFGGKGRTLASGGGGGTGAVAGSGSAGSGGGGGGGGEISAVERRERAVRAALERAKRAEGGGDA